MIVRPSAFTWLGVALLVGGCSSQDAGEDGDFDDGPSAGMGGGGLGSGGSGGGDPLVGELPPSEGNGTTVGTGGGVDGRYAEVPASGDQPSVCASCCEGAPEPGGNRLDVRVGDSNSFASPLLVEALLPTWNGVAPLPVRRDDFLNLFAPLVPEVSVDAAQAWEVAASPLDSPSGEALLTFQVAVRDLGVQRRSRTVGVLVDTSASAAASVETVLGALEGVLLGLRSEDAVGIFSTSEGPQPNVLRQFSTLGDKPIDPAELADVVSRELEDPPTKVLGPALAESMAQVRAVAVSRGENEASLVLVSDGRIEVTPEVLASVELAAADVTPTRVVAIGVGAARNYVDEALDRLATAGGGAYVYFDGSEAAESFLAERVDELFSVAIPDVRLELSLPDDLELVRLEGGELGSADVNPEGVLGQALATGGTMTFHHTLRWNGTAPFDPCAAIGWSIVARAGAEPEILASGALALGNAFAGVADSVGRRQGSAVVAASTAFQGPTRERLTAAIEALATARKGMEAAGTSWSAHPLERLCSAVSLACTRRNFDCGTCDASP